MCNATWALHILCTPQGWTIMSKWIMCAVNCLMDTPPYLCIYCTSFVSHLLTMNMKWLEIRLEAGGCHHSLHASSWLLMTEQKVEAVTAWSSLEKGEQREGDCFSFIFFFLLFGEVIFHCKRLSNFWCTFCGIIDFAFFFFEVERVFIWFFFFFSVK